MKIIFKIGAAFLELILWLTVWWNLDRGYRTVTRTGHPALTPRNRWVPDKAAHGRDVLAGCDLACWLGERLLVARERGWPTVNAPRDRRMSHSRQVDLETSWARGRTSAKRHDARRETSRGDS